MNWLYSIRTRLFFALAAAVCVSVGAVTLRESHSYIALLTQNTQASLLTDIKEARRSVETGVDENLSRLGLLVQEWGPASDQETRSQRLRSFLKTTKDSVGVFVYLRGKGKPQLLASAWTSSKAQAKFGGEIASDVATRVEAHAEKQVAKVRFVRNQSKLVDLRDVAHVPMIGLMGSLLEKSSKDDVVLFVVAWPEQIFSSFPFGEHTTSRLMDRRGRTVISPGKTLGNKWLVKTDATKAFDARRPSYTEMTKNAQGQPIMVAMGLVSSVDLAVVVERNMAPAFQAVALMQKKRLAAGAFLVQMSLLIAWIFSQGITKNLQRLTEQTAVVASGDLTSRISVNSRDETAVLTRSFNHMTDKVRELLIASAEKAAMEAELVTADSVQRTLFPKHDLANGPLIIDGFYRPAARCGGDLWGRFEIAEGVEFVYIADVMGHGVSSALVTAITFSTLRTFSELYSKGEVQKPSPAMLLGYINRILVESVESKISMTAFMAIIDTKRNEMTYSNAGHNFPLRFRPTDGKKALTVIRPGGALLGLDNESGYVNHVMEIRPRDKFFLFTDGLIEGTGPSGKQWGVRALKDVVQASSIQNASELRDAVLEKSYAHFGTVPANDDITFVVIEYRETQEAALPVAS